MNHEVLGVANFKGFTILMPLLWLIAFPICAQIIEGQQAIFKHDVPRYSKASHWKLFGGVTSSSLTNHDLSDTKFSVIFHMGVSYPFIVSNSFIFEPGIRYITKGIKFENDYYDWFAEEYLGKEKVSWNVSYIDVFGKFKFNNLYDEKNKIEPFIGVSVALAVRGAGKLEWAGGKRKDSDWFWENLWDYRAPIDVTIPVGVDFIVNRRFVVGYEFNIGLIDNTRHANMNWRFLSHIVSTGYLF